MKNWKCEKCGIEVYEVENDYDLHAFDVYLKDEYLGKVAPADIEDMDNCIKALDNGACPVCDGWDDGCGNPCSISGWGMDD